ncbi:hypothetical protein GCM10011608_16780 [Micromonospora sonchi]|uniref:Uncharacterized protein n=1 Tax=Micromonospora sonchi TaxID=1763543 RepID=A0A917WVK5_9ACTN|nr:hypothetical protein GCM10011608_16780 [Micromonospora sonchi]
MPGGKGNKAEVQELRDDVDLTQYGEDGEGFRSCLRVDIGETEMSLIIGRQSKMAVALLVTKAAPPWATARYTTVGALRQAGFEVVHSPTRGNPLHVSVFPPSGPHGPAEWDDAMATSFDKCFTESTGGDTRE